MFQLRKSPFDIFEDNFFRRMQEHSLLTDVKQSEEKLEIKVNVPGLKKENISVYLEDGILTVAVKEESNLEEQKENYIVRERNVSSTSRSFSVGENVKKEHINISLNDGVLTIMVEQGKLEQTNKEQLHIE